MGRVADALPTAEGEAPVPSPLLRPIETTPEALQRIGPYELRGVLGEGTFGIVYLADQSEPIRRRVALKVLKAHAAPREVVARFEQERRLLARLDHPCITHVLDAGVTEDGRPWFALEFVRGLPLLRHCDEAKLSIDDRLRLFQEICRAVQHAHQQGVIHRDLKPGNILVSSGRPGDGTPRHGLPKIIDFGIAEAIGDDAPPTGRTGGTLQFMSPEQALGRELDTRTDIYSLGVVLYQLLTGVLPLDDANPGDPAAFIERLRSIDPPPPSEAVRRLPPHEAARIAADRGTTPPSLVRALRGDLDWITLRCLRKDRAARYDSASDLAADLGRHFESRPVEAAPRRFVYRADRFVRRHRAMVAALLVGGALLLAATVVSISALRTAHSAHEEERRLRRELERAEGEASDAVSALLAFITSVSLDRASRGVATTPEAILEDAREAVLAPLRTQPRAQAQVRVALAKALLSLGHADAASREASAAMALLEALGSEGRSSLVGALRVQAAIDEQRGHTDAALVTLDRAQALQSTVAPESPEPWTSLLLDRARILISAGDAVGALQAVSASRDWIRRIESAPSRRRAASSAAFFEAEALLIQGRWSDALTAIEPNLEFNRVAMPGHWWIAESEAVRAAALIGMGRIDEGRRILAEVEEPLMRALPPGGSPRRTIAGLVARAFEARGLDQDAEHWRLLGSR